MLAADVATAWLVAFDGAARTSGLACRGLDELVELRLPGSADPEGGLPDDRPLLVDVIDADGAPQAGTAIRLLWFGGCGTCGWGEVEVAVSDAQGRASLGGITGERATWRGLGDGSTFALGPAFAHARPALQVLDVEAAAKGPVRFVVPQCVPAELLLVVTPELHGMPPLRMTISPAAEAADLDHDPFDRSKHVNCSIQPDVPVALDVEPFTAFAVNLMAKDYSLWLDRSFTVTDDPASRRITLPIDGGEVRHVSLIAVDEAGAPLAERELVWEIESNEEPSDPAAWRDLWSGRYLQFVRTNRDGVVELYLPANETVGDPVPRLRLLDVDRDPDEPESGGQCFRHGEASLPALLATEPATLRKTITLQAVPRLVAGRIVDPEGRSLAGATLTLHPVDHHLDHRFLTTRSNASGRFAFFATGSDRDDVYLAIGEDSGRLLRPTHDRVRDRPGPEPLLAIRRGALEAEVVVEPRALDLVALRLDRDLDPASLQVDCADGHAWRIDGGLVVSHGPPGNYELMIWRVRPYASLPDDPLSGKRIGGSQFETLTLPRRRTNAIDARLEVIDLRGKL